MLRKSYKLIVLSLIFILTGCTAEYNVNISDNKRIKESLNIVEKNAIKWDKKNEFLYNRTPKEYLNTDLKWPTSVYVGTEINPIEPIEEEDIDYYNKKNISNSLQLGINYNFEYGFIRYGNSNIINTCYNTEYLKNDTILSFKTTSPFKCFDTYKVLDEVNVNLTTDCKVIKENADKQNGNKYTWNITKVNYENKKIEFKLDCKKEYKQSNLNKPLFSIFYLIILYGLIILLIFLIIKIISYNNNKF